MLDQQTNHWKGSLPGRFIPLLDGLHTIGHRRSQFVFIPASPNERLHLYFVSVKIQLTFRDVIGESGSQSVDNALVKLQIRWFLHENHLHTLTREITGITVADNTGKDLGHDTPEGKHIHLIVRLHATQQLRSLSATESITTKLYISGVPPL